MNRAGPGIRQVVGLRLLMPGLLLVQTPGVSETTKDPGKSAQKPRAAKPAKLEPAKPGPERCVHVVKRAESLGRIAVKYRVGRSAIAAANHLTDPDALRVGQRLQIPGCRDGAPRGSRGPETVSTTGGNAPLVERVGPRRIPTQLHLAIPDFSLAVVEFEWPIEGTIVSEFGRRRRGWHAGIDVRADSGTRIRATAAGTVIFSGLDRYNGRMIRIQHPGGFTSLYANNLENLVEIGDDVRAGTVIATVGRTGHASGEHLHFEIRRHGVAGNPVHLLSREAPVLASAPPLETVPPALDVVPPSDFAPPPEDEEDRG